MTNNSGDKRIKEQVGNMQVSFDKEAAWMRLQDRMESKDEKKPYFRIAWAAAALLVATTLWYSLRDTKDVTVVKEKSEVIVPVVKEQPAAASKAEEIMVTNTQPTRVAKKHSVVKQQLKTAEAIKEVVSVPEPILVNEESAPIPEPVKVAARPKPKMRTVHINEVMADNEREYLMRDRYAAEYEIRASENSIQLPEDKYKTRNPFSSNHLIQN